MPLVLRRKEGQWVEITHTASGDTIRIRTCNIRPHYPGQLDLVFEDHPRHFAVGRDDSHKPPAPGPNAGRYRPEGAELPAEAFETGPVRAGLTARARLTLADRAALPSQAVASGTDGAELTARARQTLSDRAERPRGVQIGGADGAELPAEYEDARPVSAEQVRGAARDITPAFGFPRPEGHRSDS